MKPPKNPHSGIYLKNRRKFFAALNQLRLDHRLSIFPTQFYRRAKISKATYYRHFCSVDQALFEQEKELTESFTKIIHTLPSRTYRQSIYQYCLFVLNHRDYFDAALHHHDFHLSHQLLEIIRPELTHDWPSFDERTSALLFLLFCSATDIALENWQQHQFSPESLDATINHLRHFTDTFIIQIHHLAHLVSTLQDPPKTPEHN